MEFFVDIDQETIRRIIVRPLGASRFSVTTTLLLDRGMEVQADKSEIEGVAKLRRELARTGVEKDRITATFGAEPRWYWPIWMVSATSLASSVVIAWAVMTICDTL